MADEKRGGPQRPGGKAGENNRGGPGSRDRREGGGGGRGPRKGGKGGRRGDSNGPAKPQRVELYESLKELTRGEGFRIDKFVAAEKGTHKPVKVEYRLTREGLKGVHAFPRLSDAQAAATAPLPEPEPEPEVEVAAAEAEVPADAEEPTSTEATEADGETSEESSTEAV